MSKRVLKVGDVAPDVTLSDQTGQGVSLRSLWRKSVVVLYFYPKDDTPGCTVEACTFRDEHQQFVDAGATVVGISSDSVESHRLFAQKYKLPYQLLSDGGGRVRAFFGVPKTLGIIDGRVTYIIDRNGVIRSVFSSQVQVRRHVDEALKMIRELADPLVNVRGDPEPQES